MMHDFNAYLRLIRYRQITVVMFSSSNMYLLVTKFPILSVYILCVSFIWKGALIEFPGFQLIIFCHQTPNKQLDNNTHYPYADNDLNVNGCSKHRFPVIQNLCTRRYLCQLVYVLQWQFLTVYFHITQPDLHFYKQIRNEMQMAIFYIVIFFHYTKFIYFYVMCYFLARQFQLIMQNTQS